MAPHQNSGDRIAFSDLMAIEKINDVTYRSKAAPFSPGGFGWAYGGHVYAQAAWAAAQTVPRGLILHNVTGFFLLPGLTTVPFVYTIEPIRDGASYSTRIVKVTQAEGKGICFTCTCSFKTPEPSPLDVQAPIDLWRSYPSVLTGKRESDFPSVPGADFSRYLDAIQDQGGMQTYTGLDTRKVDMRPHNDPLTPLERRQLLFYRADGALGPEVNANLHACAHLYASDINSLFIVANLLDISDVFTAAASISHTVIFHVPVEEMVMEREQQEEKKVWYCKEDWTTRAADGRCMHYGRLVGPGGRHVASTVQDGVMRLPRSKKDYDRLPTKGKGKL